MEITVWKMLWSELNKDIIQVLKIFLIFLNIISFILFCFNNLNF